MLINKLDNVDINLDDGHKYALRDIKAGENIIKYGNPIGHAVVDIKKGEHVHNHNIKTNLSGNLEYIKRYNKMPETLIFAFAKLIEFYKTDMPQDAPEVIEFMKNHNTREILANVDFWGQDLTFLAEEIEKC